MKSVFEFIFVILIIGVVIVFFGFTTYTSYCYGAEIYKAYVLSGSWEKSIGKITTSKTIMGCGRSGTNYSPAVTYSYHVGAVEYTSKKIGFGNRYCSGKRSADLMAARFPIASENFVYFNPKEPADSVLIRGHVENGTLFQFFATLSFPLIIISLFIKSMIQAKQQKIGRPDAIEILMRNEKTEYGARTEIRR